MPTRTRTRRGSSARPWLPEHHRGEGVVDDVRASVATKPPSRLSSDAPVWPGDKGDPRKRNPILSIICLGCFLVSWVANGEILQRITTAGTFWGDGTTTATPYNQPVWITWFSYNFMILSGLSAAMCEWCCCQHQQQDAVKHNLPTHSNQNKTKRQKDLSWRALLRKWSGKLGLFRCMVGCTFISYLLQVLNICMILGLDCISVSLSNGVYQIQAGITVVFSVWWLGDSCSRIEVAGLGVAGVGITLLVLPPIVWEQPDNNDDPANHIMETTAQCMWHSSKIASTLTGAGLTGISAVIGALYLVSWRIFDERRGLTGDATTSLEGLMDTQLTLAMIGVCNFCFGWPMIVFAHWSGLEEFKWPLTSHEIMLLSINGIVEYLFDATCAVAIYTTSPVTVAVVSPLTVLLSSIVDYWWIDPSDPTSISYTQAILSCFGIVLTMVGLYVKETKPESLIRMIDRLQSSRIKLKDTPNDQRVVPS